MLGRFDLGFGRNRERALTAGKAVLAVVMLAGCSSIPDAVNPVEWYKSAEDLVTGSDRTEAAATVPPKGEYPDVYKTPADTRKDLAKGLPADKGNLKYAEPVRREVSPTRQLARKAPADTQVAAAPQNTTPKTTAPQAATVQPAVPPKPAVTTQELPPPSQVAQAAANRLSPDRRTQQARDEGPTAPPASVNMTPPQPADVPETVPVRGRGRPLQEQFQKRLAESASQTVHPGMVDMPQAVATASTGTSAAFGVREDEPIHLVPPSSKRAVKGGGKGLAAPAPQPAASFQVASVDFRAGSSELTSADRSAIAEVARLYKQTGGIVRVVGYSPSAALGHGDAVQQMMGGLEASMQRANAVARELAKRGVPARKIMVGADGAADGGTGAQVYIDVL
ncbi:MAG: OmpA family protein [Magnetospirillum sp.]|nr:OmpA family protein [Magnetospirillum sp.]